MSAYRSSVSVRMHCNFDSYDEYVPLENLHKSTPQTIAWMRQQNELVKERLQIAEQLGMSVNQLPSNISIEDLRARMSSPLFACRPFGPHSTSQHFRMLCELLIAHVLAHQVSRASRTSVAMPDPPVWTLQKMSTSKSHPRARPSSLLPMRLGLFDSPKAICSCHRCSHVRSVKRVT